MLDLIFQPIFLIIGVGICFPLPFVFYGVLLYINRNDKTYQIKIRFWHVIIFLLISFVVGYLYTHLK
ncbi:MAG: hypothetical protein JWN90_38 [Parcubacteria group bacterium]|nr:hypothetical protein [Parcubacteria group bacterium]